MVFVVDIFSIAFAIMSNEFAIIIIAVAIETESLQLIFIY